MTFPLVAAVLILLSGCGGTAGRGGGTSDETSAGRSPAGVRVVASTSVYGDIARQIGGDLVTVTSIIDDPQQDPHSYEAGPRTQLALSKAQVIIENGGGYDDFADKMIKAAGNPSARVLNAVELSGRTAPAGGELNEHVWYDLPAMSRLADALADALGQAAPADAATFTANAAAFTERIDALRDREAALAGTAKGTPVAITEPVPLYLLTACGLTNVTPEEFSEALEEGDDVAPAVLRDTLGLFAAKKAELLVYNEQTAGPQTELVKQAALDAGVPALPVTETLPAGKDYLTWMDDTIDALGKVLSR